MRPRRPCRGPALVAPIGATRAGPRQGRRGRIGASWKQCQDRMRSWRNRLSAVIEEPDTSATRRKPARIEGKHGADPNLQVLHRRRAAHRGGHECRTNILPMAAFVYAAFATMGRASRGLAVSSYAQGAEDRQSSAAVVTAAKSTAAPSVHGKRARRRSMLRRSATRGVLVASGAGPTARAAIAGGTEK
jgi:hypothetical protein